MAWYKYDQYVKKENTPAYEAVQLPGRPASHAGIYRCTKCGHEVAIGQGSALPAQPHPQHPTTLGPVEWKLLVFAQHNHDA